MADNEAKPIGINTASPSPGKIVLGLATSRETMVKFLCSAYCQLKLSVPVT